MRLRHPQPPSSSSALTNLATGESHKRSVWVPQHFVSGSSPSMHEQQIQQRQLENLQKQHLNSTTIMGIDNTNTNGLLTGCTSTMQQQCQPQLGTPLITRSNSSVASSYQTNSLPRMSSCRLMLLQQRQNAGENFYASGWKSAASIATPTNASSAAVMKICAERSEHQRRRLYRIALNFFNKKPERGVQLLIRWGFVEENPKTLARFFKERRGLSKQMIGEYLGTLKSPFHAAVLNFFIAEIPMYDMEIDKALRQLVMQFRLPGEAQKIDHIIQAFAHHYVACNSHRLSAQDTADTMYILAFAVIMLNTDLHTPSLKDSRRMKLDEFIKNLCRVEEGRNLDKQMLAGIYARVKEFEFKAGTDHVTQVMKMDQSIISKDKPKLVEPHRRLICYCRLHQIKDSNKRLRSEGRHERDIFLFNDMMLVCKRKSDSSSTHTYLLRYSTLLIGLNIEEFQNSLYENGLIMNFPDGQTLMFNALNGDDRLRFVADIRESVTESTETEQWHLQLEMERQQHQHHNHQQIGARLAEHDFQLSSAAITRRNRFCNNGVNQIQPNQQQHENSIGSNNSAASIGMTTIGTNMTENSVQRDSGLPDMDYYAGNSFSAGHSHSTTSSPQFPQLQDTSLIKTTKIFNLN